jgi:phosphohistidine swiveling domain-containing protein
VTKQQLKPLPPRPYGATYKLTLHEPIVFASLSSKGRTAPYYKKVLGVDYGEPYYEQNDSVIYVNLTDMNLIRALSPDLDPEIVAQKVITAMSRTARQLIRTVQIVSNPSRWRKEHFAQDLLEDLNTLWEAYLMHSPSLNGFSIVQSFLMDCLSKELRKNGFDEEVEQGCPSFVVPSEPNYLTLEQKNLITLKSRFGNQLESKQATKAIEDHINSFNFVYQSTTYSQSPKSTELIKQMGYIKAKPTDETKTFNTDCKKIKRLGELVGEMAFWKHERLDAFSIANQRAEPMYKAVAELIGLPLNLVYAMTTDEITNAINGKKVDKEYIEQRAKCWCLASIDGKIDFYQPTPRQSKQETAAKVGDVLQGRPASPGIVRGRVRILPMGAENPELGTDEIIVTQMTRPELGVALNTALAYVTDEGGRLCHAAIVAREFKKPCVVATENATELLRDGMLIEVDGTAGTVTVINAGE